MSSTNRGSKRSPADNYGTPGWCVHRLLDEPPEVLKTVGKNWIEPCAGDGNIIKAVEDWHNIRGEKPPTFDAVELRKVCRKKIMKRPSYRTLYCPQDFLEWQPPKTRYDVCITNPPFWCAQPILEKCLSISKVVILLLRLNYVGSEKRHEFMRSAMPNDTLVLPNRPAFSKNKQGKLGTDSIEYAWFVWDSAFPTPEGRIRMLDLTPLDQRRSK